MTIEEKLNNLPQKSGVYLMYDSAGNVIYVGKAVVLKNRVRQYFNNSPKDVKVNAMVENIADFGYIITLSEKDALSLESNLVKKYKPRYNILLKDDKSSPYIKIDTKKDFPCIEITRKIVADGARYFGPYFNGIYVKDMVAIIKSAYHMRTCSTAIRPKEQGNNLSPKNKRECLNYHIKLCPAPCAGHISKEDYAKIVDKTIAFLSGKDDSAAEILTKKMQAAVNNEDFEHAILLRDQLAMLNKLKERNISDLSKFDDIDSFAIVSDGDDCAVSVNIVRAGKMMGVKNYIIQGASLSLSDALSSFTIQYYNQNSIPKNICYSLFGNKNSKNTSENNITIENNHINTSENTYQFETLKNYLCEKRGGAVNIEFPQKGVKKRLIEMSRQNAKDFLATSAQKHERIREMTIGACKRLEKILSCPYPRRIECYDISNISGTDKVASGVVFIDGAPSNSDYRRYKIKTVEGSDDFASLAEVMRRRFKKDVQLPPADLIVIDGGKGQLASAYAAACETVQSNSVQINNSKQTHNTAQINNSKQTHNTVQVTNSEQTHNTVQVTNCEQTHNTVQINDNEQIYNISQPSGNKIPTMISLAKKEEIICTLTGEIHLEKSDYALRLLQRIRDEAHRFAITYHRTLRSKRMESELLAIPGVGKKTVKKLLSAVGISELSTLPASELSKKAGVSLALVQRIKEFLQKQST